MKKYQMGILGVATAVGVAVMSSVGSGTAGEKSACAMSAGDLAETSAASCPMTSKASSKISLTAATGAQPESKAKSGSCGMDAAACGEKMAKSAKSADCGPCDGKGLVLYLNEEGAWYANNWKVDADKLKAKLAKAQEADSPAPVMLRIEKETPAEALKELVSFLGSNGVQSVTVATANLVEPAERISRAEGEPPAADGI